MKTDYLINFKLFCNRRGFNLEQWIRSSTENSYEKLSEMLISLKVCPPSEDEYSVIKNKIEAESVKEEVVEPKKPVKPAVKSSRRKKKNEKDSV
tara:strand:+ start:8896 stop:9177 length:282 start_codon:yes stop_codon:yes gene_type:complete